MEAESGVGRISLVNGLAALQTAARQGGPAVLAMLPMKWNRVFAEGGAPPFLSAFDPTGGATRDATGDEAATLAGGVSLEKEEGKDRSGSQAGTEMTAKM